LVFECFVVVVQGLVIRTECVEFMPFYLSISTFLMSASFAMYGLLLRDFFIYVNTPSHPNFIVNDNATQRVSPAE